MKIARIILAAIFVFFLAGKVAEAGRITVVYPSPSWNTHMPIMVAQELGIFAREGLEVQSVYVRGGPTAIAALLSGGADYAVVAGIPAVSSIARGAAVLIVSGFSARIDYTLIGRPGVSTVQDLRGKILGVTGAGGMAEFATVTALAKEGLYRDKDYSLRYVGNSAARIVTLEKGIISAAPFSATERVQLVSKGFPVIMDIGDVLSDYPFLVVLTSQRKIQTNPREVVAFLRAIERAMELIHTNKSKAIAAAVKVDPKANVDVQSKAMPYFAKGFTLRITKKNIDALIAAAKLQTVAKKMGGSEKFFTTKFVRRVLVKK